MSAMSVSVKDLKEYTLCRVKDLRYRHSIEEESDSSEDDVQPKQKRVRV